MNDAQDKIDAGTAYLHTLLETSIRAVDGDLVTLEQMVNIALGVAVLLASTKLGPAAAATMVQERVASLAVEMRGEGRREDLN